MSVTQNNVDASEAEKFARQAADWWDYDGPLRTLHQINPIRLDFIRQQSDINAVSALDVGCGGGILAEALARNGARVTGIDIASPLIETATNHARLEQLDIVYECTSAEALANRRPESFQLLCCLELLEHVPDAPALVEACARLLCPGGVAVIATINRTPRAYAETIVAGEHLLGLLPRGTHHYSAYTRPSELAGWCRAAGLEVTRCAGMRYAPITHMHRLTGDVSVNYLLAASKPR